MDKKEQLLIIKLSLSVFRYYMNLYFCKNFLIRYMNKQYYDILLSEVIEDLKNLNEYWRLKNVEF